MTKQQVVERSENLIETDRELHALEPLTEYRDAKQPGLVIRKLASGSVQFSVRYRVPAIRDGRKILKQVRMRVGTYPAVTLAEARKRARRATSALDEKRDPAAEARAALAPHEDTIKKLADLYLKKHARPKKDTADEDERALTVEVLPFWADRSVRDLRRRHVGELLDGIVDRGSPIMANRVLSLIRKMLNFAISEGWIDANPAAGMEKPSREVSRDRVLDDDEIRRVWRVLSNLPETADRPAPGRKTARGRKNADPVCPISAALAAMTKVRLLTAQRGGEVARMRWCDVDLHRCWWTIPADDAKNGEQHRVPLTQAAIEIIKARKPEREHREEAYVFIGTGESLFDRAKKAPAAIARVLDIDFRGHDLRRTAATRMAAAGVTREHIAHVLNHVEGGARATRVYDRHTYDKEKRTALEAWARELDRILKNDPPASNVVSIRA